MKDRIRLPCLEMLPDRRSTFIRRYITLEGERPRYWLDGGDVYANDQAARWHGFGGDLAPGLSSSVLTDARARGGPYPWRSTEIQQHLALFEKAILSVELDELKGGSCSVAFFLCQLRGE